MSISFANSDVVNIGAFSPSSISTGKINSTGVYTTENASFSKVSAGDGNDTVFTVTVGESRTVGGSGNSNHQPLIYNLEWCAVNSNGAALQAGRRIACITFESNTPSINVTEITRDDSPNPVTVNEAIVSVSGGNFTFTITLVATSLRTVANLSISSYTRVLSIS